jgi:hypothetical protein
MILLFAGTDQRHGHREFAESTILTIAHRLRTVIDYDRVRSFFPPHSLGLTNGLDRTGHAP